MESLYKLAKKLIAFSVCLHHSEAKDTSITMERFYIFMLSLITCFAAAAAASCEDGWVAYKDELCVKTFTHLLNYDDAKDFCSSKGEVKKTSKSYSLLMVKDPDFQSFLANYTHGIYDNIWLGSKSDNETEAGEFKWNDGVPLNYSNWQENYPRNVTDMESCIELRPIDMVSPESPGKWADVTCQKRNLVVCQTELTWTTDDTILEIKRMRKQRDLDLNHLNHKLEEANAEIAKLHEDLETVSALVVPVGSIYIEYNGQSSPESLWPSLKWQDISSTYGGLFFRVLGGGAASWGSTQGECAPRITNMDFHARPGTRFSYSVSIPSSGWSERGSVGDNSDNGGTHWREGIRLYTAGCEVRPKNQAVRIWKRIE